MQKPTHQDFQQRLKQYAALGAAFLASAPAANAAVIVTDPPDIVLNTPANFQVDLNNDMVPDLNVSAGYGWGGYAGLLASPLAGNSLIGNTIGTALFPYALPYGYLINNSGNFNPAQTYNTLHISNSSGNWAPPTSGYLGVKFQIAGNTHYGWVQLTTNSNSQVTIEAWGYEDTQNTGLPAGGAIMPPVVPTLSEWGLISFILLLLSFGTVFIARKEGEFVLQSTKGKGFRLSAAFQKPPFVKALFKKALLGTGAIGIALGALSLALTGTITLVDIVGFSVAGPVFAYLTHLMMWFEKKRKED
jgi:hypothetical protein